MLKIIKDSTLVPTPIVDLKLDPEPREGSTDPVTSEGVKSAIDGAVGDAAEALQEQIDDIAEKAGSGYIPKGEATVATLNGLSDQENGWLYTMTDAGTLTDGSLAVVAGDTVAWDATNSVWYKAMDYAPRQYGTNEVHNLPTTITTFRTGDVIPVDGPSGTAKMSKDDLLKETAENALGSREVQYLEDSVGGSPIFGASSSTQSFACDLKAGDNVVMRVKNNYSSAGYYSFSLYDTENGTLVYQTANTVVDSSEEKYFKTTIPVAVTYATFNNTSSRPSEYELRSENAMEYAERISGECVANSVSVGVRAGTSGDVSLKAGKKILVKIENASGSSGYFEIKLYTTNGGELLFSTGNQPISANSSYSVNAYLPKDATYYTLTNVNNQVANIVIAEQTAFERIDELENPCVICDISGCSKSNKNLSRTDGDDSVTFTPTATGSATYLTLTTKISLAVGDFGFARVDIKPKNDFFGYVAIYTDNSEVYSYRIGLKAGEKRTIYVRTKNVSTAGVLKVNVGMFADDNLYATQEIEVSRLIIVKNGYSAYRNESEKESLKDFSDTKYHYVVSASGDGHFVTINQGVYYLKNLLGTDVDVIPSTLFIRDGVYDMEASKTHAIGYPYATVNKGSNKISLIGESREGVVLSYVNNSAVRLKVLDIGFGECSIENMTIKSLQDATYTDTSGDGHQNCYCIHSDLGSDRSEKYKTLLKNLRLFSHCASPLGAGIGKYQDLVIDDCIFESDTKVGNSSGACYVHALANGDGSYDSTMSLEIRNCDFRSYDSTNAITLPAVGSSTFANIKTTINNMRVYSSGTPVNASVTSADLQPECSGNNMSALNLAEY